MLTATPGPKYLTNTSPSSPVSFGFVLGLFSSLVLLPCSQSQCDGWRSHPEEEIRPYPPVLRTCHGSLAPSRESLNCFTWRINSPQKLVPANLSPQICSVTMNMYLLPFIKPFLLSRSLSLLYFGPRLLASSILCMSSRTQCSCALLC